MNEKLCPQCLERPAKKGYCARCQTEYNRIWKSNHRKNPPKGFLKGNWRKAEKDFPLPPVTMCYTTFEGGIICGHDKAECDFVGTRTTSEGKEDQWFCPKCKVSIYIPHCIYPRLQVIRPDRERNPVSSGGNVRNIFNHGVF